MDGLEQNTQAGEELGHIVHLTLRETPEVPHGKAGGRLEQDVVHAKRLGDGQGE